MGNIGGKRNYGYGKQLAWAGKQALLDRYGRGHYATRKAHAERWMQFAKHVKEKGIHDARHIDRITIEHYANTVKQAVEQKNLSVAYAQNLLSTVNVVLATLRKDRKLVISPKQYVGERTHVRQIVPCMDYKGLVQLYNQFARSYSPANTQHSQRDSNNLTQHVVMVARLAREFGLRFREASLLDARQAIKEARKQNRINITEGTKGGRGKEKDRWLPINATQLQTLQQAAELQQQQRNLIPPEMSFVKWRNFSYNQWRKIAKPLNIKGFHELRAAYACVRYQQLTGHPAPVIAGGQRQAPKTVDQEARKVLAQELGHGRTDVIAAYIGSI